MKFYISGPMSGYPGYNYSKFDEVCQRVRDAGHIAIAPQEIDRICGYCGCFDVTPQMRSNFLVRDLLFIASEATAIVVLNDWEKSSGAVAEVMLARALKLPVYDEFLNPLHVTINIKSWSHD